MSALNLDSNIVRNPDLVATEMDGELVMMSIDQGEYYGLNRVAARIWELLDAATTVEQLCQRLTQEFEISPDQCQTEVLAFADELLAQGLIHENQ